MKQKTIDNSVWQKSFLSSLILSVAILFCVSCKKQSTPDEPKPEPTQKPLPTKHGNSTGSIISKVINSEGGTIVDSTGNLKIVVPQGAVDGPVNFTIEPVENTFIAGFGTSFRLKPENTTFKKDLEISIKYNDDELKGIPKAALFLSYQDAQGYWRKASGCTNDTVNNILKVNTKHFSDWTFSSEIGASNKGDYFGTIKVKQNEEAKIEIFGLRHFSDGEFEDVIVAPYDIKGKVLSWSLYGKGTLTPNGDEATYKAPDNFTSNEIAVVVANVKGVDPTKPESISTVVKRIVLINDEYIEFRLAGVQHVKSYPTMLYRGGVLLLGTGFTLSYKGSRVGTYQFGPIEVPGNVFVSLASDQGVFPTENTCNGVTLHSSGKVIITSGTGYIEGRFYGEFFKQNLLGCPSGKVSASGTFRVKVE